MRENKKDLVERIVAIEAEMFLQVPTAEEPPCRAYIEDMKLHRRGQFAGWSENTCASYLKDLEKARSSGKNLMTLKYARMDNLIPRISSNPLIQRIRERFVRWQEEVIETYPNIMKGARDLDDFANYLDAELQTYSDATLELLAADADTCCRAGGNMSLEIYKDLAGRSGYDSIEAFEKNLRKSM